MKKEDAYYERLMKKGSGLPMDDLKKFAEEKKKKMKEELAEAKRNNKKNKGK